MAGLGRAALGCIGWEEAPRSWKGWSEGGGTTWQVLAGPHWAALGGKQHQVLAGPCWAVLGGKDVPGPGRTTLVCIGWEEPPRSWKGCIGLHWVGRMSQVLEGPHWVTLGGKGIPGPGRGGVRGDMTGPGRATLGGKDFLGPGRAALGEKQRQVLAMHWVGRTSQVLEGVE